MPTKTLLVLADVSFDLGMIGEDEYRERVKIAIWLSEEGNNSDPRSDEKRPDDMGAVETEALSISSEVALSGTNGLDRPDWLHFIAFKKWYFTRSDPDPYPSTPHGHLNSANQTWPKLNPYTGRVFKAKHQEDPSMRLGKKAMQELWRTEAFRDFCRSYILWYMEAYPHYKFSVRHSLRLPRW